MIQFNWFDRTPIVTISMFNFSLDSFWPILPLALSYISCYETNPPPPHNNINSPTIFIKSFPHNNLISLCIRLIHRFGRWLCKYKLANNFFLIHNRNNLKQNYIILVYLSHEILKYSRLIDMLYLFLAASPIDPLGFLSKEEPYRSRG